MGSRAWMGVLLVAAALVTSAGACGREGPDGPLPEPSDAGAAPLPAGVVAGGLDATFANETWLDEDGDQCYLVYRLHVSGLAESDYRCADEIERILGNDDEIATDDEVGDYGHRDGRIWIRIVWWDDLAEEAVLTEREAVFCGGELYFIPGPNSSPYLRVDPFELITGSTPPADADPAICPPPPATPPS